VAFLGENKWKEPDFVRGPKIHRCGEYPPPPECNLALIVHCGSQYFLKVADFTPKQEYVPTVRPLNKNGAFSLAARSRASGDGVGPVREIVEPDPCDMMSKVALPYSEIHCLC
jgi:hypothetical protein